MKKPSDLAVAILLKRMKGKKPGADDAEEPDEADEDEKDEGDDEPIAPTAEVAAFKKLRSAIASEDDAKGAKALKQFLEACGVYEE